MSGVEMLRPPVHRGIKVLDRSLFKQQISLSAARVFENSNIHRVRKDLERSRDTLDQPRLTGVRPDPLPERQGHKCILLRPQCSLEGHALPWSPTVEQLRVSQLIEVIPYELERSYDDWTYEEIMHAILPLDDQGEIPSSFSAVGHVAHFNLRDQYLRYKDLIGELILDKCIHIRTVINKIDTVGEEDEYRTFQYEVLAGENDMNVEVKEQDCVFRFDYSKVYWNSRLQAEHTRLVNLFQPGEAICDVMGGIGPFAIPAGKKGCFVWANDLNPESYNALTHCIVLNKVGNFVQPFNEDGHTFIKSAGVRLRSTSYSTVTQETVRVPPPRGSSPPTRESSATKAGRQQKRITKQTTHIQPRFFSHYIMNLPATATDFLPDFIGLYADIPQDSPHRPTEMPWVHCYCFETKSADNAEETRRICALVSQKLGVEIKVGVDGTNVHDVRDVAPKKRMFCVSFKLPTEVAYRKE